MQRWLTTIFVIALCKLVVWQCHVVMMPSGDARRGGERQRVAI
jgi:hypothetical protein